MKMLGEDGSEPTPEQVAGWLGQKDSDLAALTSACEDLAGAFLTCGERCGLERFINYLVDQLDGLARESTGRTDRTPFPWQQHGSSPLREALVSSYLENTFIGSDRQHVPSALEKIGSSRVLTHEERSGYPY